MRGSARLAGLGVVVGVAVGMVVFLAGCGGADDEAGRAPVAAERPAPPPQARAAESAAASAPGPVEEPAGAAPVGGHAGSIQEDTIEMVQLDDVTVGPPEDDRIPECVLRLEYTSGVDGRKDWALVWPPEGGSDWVVNLHGHGSTGDQLYTRGDIRRNWLPQFQERGMGILTPNLRDNAWMGPAAAADLRALLQYVRDEYGASRFFFVSGSMGGAGNLVYAVLHPEDVSGVVAMCPAADVAAVQKRFAPHPPGGILRQIADCIRDGYGGTPDEKPQVYQRHNALEHADRLTMPVYVAHGNADTVLRIAGSRALAAKCGDNLKYREIEKGGHDSPLAARYVEEGLKWVLDGEATP